MINKELNKELLLIDIRKLVTKKLHIDILRKQSKELCLSYFPCANDYLITAVMDYAQYLQEFIYSSKYVNRLFIKYKGVSKQCY